MSQPGPWPDQVAIDKPSQARMYDYVLGGSHNFAVDREAAEKVLQANPEGRLGMFANRTFLRRAVRLLVASGVRQFLDVGSGIPTVGNVHEVAQKADPECRIVYVDVDPAAVEHSRRILAGNDRVAAVEADIRTPELILSDRDVMRQLDLREPVGLLMLCVLHFVPDDEDPVGLVARYLDRLAPGSYLAISHVTEDGRSAEHTEAMKVYSKVMTRVNTRSHAHISRFFTGLEMVEPGLEWVQRWRSEPGDDLSTKLYYYSGVGRKP